MRFLKIKYREINAWLRFCQIDETEINSGTMICNNHFKEQDFLYRVTDNKLILKKDAVPCITKSTKHKKRLYQEMTDFHANNASNSTMKLMKEELNVGFESINNKISNTATLEENNDKDVISTTKDTISKPQVKSELDERLINIHSNNTSDENNINLKSELIIQEYYINIKSELESEYLDNKISDGAVIEQNNVVENNVFPQMTEDETRRSSPKLRYVGDITASHLATPRRAKKALDIAIMNIKQQRKKIKALQQTSYRFKKKMKSLKDLVQQLRKQDLITENAAQILLSPL